MKIDFFLPPQNSCIFSFIYYVQNYLFTHFGGGGGLGREESLTYFPLLCRHDIGDLGGYSFREQDGVKTVKT